MLRALAHHANGDANSAAADLAAALIVGVPAGYCRLFLDEGQPMLNLLGQFARTAAPDVRTHAEHLLAASRRPLAPPPASVGDAGAEELSERELQVLRLLATELSGPEIASQLYVSVNTLRTHTKHIFSKLDVNTRRAAVRRAGGAWRAVSPTAAQSSPQITSSCDVRSPHRFLTCRHRRTPRPAPTKRSPS